MQVNKKRTIGIIIVALLWMGLAIASWAMPQKDVSDSERRPLAQFPELSIDTILSGKFVEQFEDYTLDQFPARDTFRTVKSLFHYYVMQQKDNNDIYIEDGYAIKMEYPLNEKSLENANKYFNKIYKKYLENTNCNMYMSVVPDKNYYVGNENGYLTMDYSKLFEDIALNNSWADYIDITNTLSVDDYYHTDTHWKQERIVKVAQLLCEKMGVSCPEDNDYSVVKVERPFYGVYYGQTAIPFAPDDVYILSNNILEDCVVTDFETNKKTKIYDKSMLKSKDLYDIYLSGAKAILTIENPNATNEKELIVFRDSFGSSIAPLLASSYSKVTLIDIRYVSTDFIGNFVNFKNQDVLFLYSTLVLNSSFSFK